MNNSKLDQLAALADMYETDGVLHVARDIRAILAEDTPAATDALRDAIMAVMTKGITDPEAKRLHEEWGDEVYKAVLPFTPTPAPMELREKLEALPKCLLKGCMTDMQGDAQWLVRIEDVLSALTPAPKLRKSNEEPVAWLGIVDQGMGHWHYEVATINPDGVTYPLNAFPVYRSVVKPDSEHNRECGCNPNWPLTDYSALIIKVS